MIKVNHALNPELNVLQFMDRLQIAINGLGVVRVVEMAAMSCADIADGERWWGDDAEERMFKIYSKELMICARRIKKLKKLKHPGFCAKCIMRKGQAKHTCPYKLEINNDKRTRCNCCVTCELNCRDDI